MTTHNDDAKIRDRVLELCCATIPGWDVHRVEALDRFCDLILKWNAVTSLVSQKDTQRLWSHVADSLSLVTVAFGLLGTPPRLLDLGSGGGFPAIPLALAVPALEVVMVERSRKKAGFLENVIGELRLQAHVSVENGAFPEDVWIEDPKGCLITARAVERPEIVWLGVRELVSNGAIFLCQWAEVPEDADAMFHVEQIIDDWTRAGLRRGLLHVIRPRPPSQEAGEFTDCL